MDETENNNEKINQASPDTDKVEVPENVENPEGKIRKLEEENTQLFNRLQRALADLKNYQKKAAKDHEEAIQEAEQQAMERFLFPMIDDLERALKAAGDPGSKSDDILYHGINLVRENIYGLLKQLDIEPIDAQGKLFDPLFHEAIMKVPAKDIPENSIVQVMTRGYTREGRTIRPACVVIATSSKSEENQKIEF